MSTTAVDLQPLRAVDRCDRCGAQAFVRAKMKVGELLFCAHHGKENLPKLREKAVAVLDETWRLDEVVATPEK